MKKQRAVKKENQNVVNQENCNSTKLKYSTDEMNIYGKNDFFSLILSILFGILISVLLGCFLIYVDSTNDVLRTSEELIRLNTMDSSVIETFQENLDTTLTLNHCQMEENESKSLLSKIIEDEAEYVTNSKSVDETSEKLPNLAKETEIDSDIVKNQPFHPTNSLNIKEKSSRIDVAEEIMLDIEKQIVDAKEIHLNNAVENEKIAHNNPLDNLSYNKLMEKREIEELYVDIESMVDDILKLDSTNDMVKEIEPHLRGILMDLEGGSFLGLKDALVHIKAIFLDQKERLLHDDSLKNEVLPNNDEKSTVSSNDSELNDRVPVDEIVPPPIYIAPRGINEDDGEHLANSESETHFLPKLKDDNLSSVNSAQEVTQRKDSGHMDEINAILSDSSLGKDNDSATISKRNVVRDTQPKSEKEKSAFTMEKIKYFSQCLSTSDFYDIHNKYNKVADDISGRKEMKRSGTTEEPETERTTTTEDEVRKNLLLNHDSIFVQELERDEEDFIETAKIANAAAIKKPLEALVLYESLFKDATNSVWILLRRAQLLDCLSEKEQSNHRLEQAITSYKEIVSLAEQNNGSVPVLLLKNAAFRCADRMNFRGVWREGLNLLNRLERLLPNDVDVLNRIGVFYLLRNEKEAKPFFETVLKSSPNNGIALVHYGFILSVLDKNYTGAAHCISLGIQTNDEGVHDVRFYSQLGNALQRLGQEDKAYEIYDMGVERGLFLSRYQRSSYNVNRLKAQPIWTPKETTYEAFFKKLKSHWLEIKEEGIKAYKNSQNTKYENEREGLLGQGSWSMMNLYIQGRKITKNCNSAPVTCSIIDEFSSIANCRRGQVKFSVLEPNTKVHPHTGPTNCRLRVHLGLIIPPHSEMQVVNTTLRWIEGDVLIFDDSFEHHVWNDSDSLRLILIVDVWHPELTEAERQSLSRI